EGLIDVSARRHDVQHAVAGGLQVISDQRAMAAPPHGFGAKYCGAAPACQLQQARASAREFGAGHMVGITAKRWVAPDRVDRVRGRAPAAAEFIDREIAD